MKQNSDSIIQSFCTFEMECASQWSKLLMSTSAPSRFTPVKMAIIDMAQIFTNIADSSVKIIQGPITSTKLNIQLTVLKANPLGILENPSLLGLVLYQERGKI